MDAVADTVPVGNHDRRRKEREGMRDFNAIKKNEMSSIENRVRHVYNIGYETGYADGQKHDLEHTENIVRSHEKCKSVLKAEYERGLNDAWRVVTEFLLMGDFDRGMTFNTRFLDELLKLEPQNAVERLKLYNEKSEPIVRCCKNCKHSENGMIGNKKRCEVCYYDEVSKGNKLFEPMETDNSKIEVGDKVVTVEDFDGINILFPIGTVGIVKQINEYSKEKYKVAAGDDWWWYREDMIELVKDDQQIEEVFEKLKNE